MASHNFIFFISSERGVCPVQSHTVGGFDCRDILSENPLEALKILLEIAIQQISSSADDSHSSVNLAE